MSKDASAVSTATHKPAEPGTAMRTGSGTSNPHPDAMCVMWTSQPPPSGLLRALAQRGVKTRAFSGPYSAIAGACARRTEFPQAPCVFLFVEPKGLPNPTPVVAALKQYAPRTRIWVYESGRTDELRALRPEDLDSWSPVEPARPAAARPIERAGHGSGAVRGVSPQLRLAGGDDVQAPPPPSDTPEVTSADAPEYAVSMDDTHGPTPASDPDASLSGEELSMLLGRTAEESGFGPAVDGDRYS